jgi:hypothetical protein
MGQSAQEDEKISTLTNNSCKLDNFPQENLINAFQSKLFVDDCDLNIKLKAIGEI